MDLDLIFSGAFIIFCAGFLTMLIAVVPILTCRSRTRYAKYLMRMNKNEQVEFSRKSFRFITILVIGVVIGIFGILFSLLFKQEQLIKYFFSGLAAYVLVAVILGQLFVYRIPRNRK